MGCFFHMGTGGIFLRLVLRFLRATSLLWNRFIHSIPERTVNVDIRIPHTPPYAEAYEYACPVRVLDDAPDNGDGLPPMNDPVVSSYASIPARRRRRSATTTT